MSYNINVIKQMYNKLITYHSYKEAEKGRKGNLTEWYQQSKRDTFFFWTNKRDSFSSPLNVHAWIEREKSAHSHSMSISFSLSSFDIYVEREGWGQMMATPFMLAASTSLLVIETYTARNHQHDYFYASITSNRKSQ